MRDMTITAIREQHDTCHGKPDKKKREPEAGSLFLRRNFWKRYDPRKQMKPMLR